MQKHKFFRHNRKTKINRHFSDLKYFNSDLQIYRFVCKTKLRVKIKWAEIHEQSITFFQHLSNGFVDLVNIWNDGEEGKFFGSYHQVGLKKKILCGRLISNRVYERVSVILVIDTCKNVKLTSHFLPYSVYNSSELSLPETIL